MKPFVDIRLSCASLSKHLISSAIWRREPRNWLPPGRAGGRAAVCEGVLVVFDRCAYCSRSRVYCGCLSRFPS